MTGIRRRATNGDDANSFMWRLRAVEDAVDVLDETLDMIVALQGKIVELLSRHADLLR